MNGKMKNRKIINRKYFAVELRLASPLSISNGENENTDADVLRNGSGDLFIPGSSLAGAFRDYQKRNYPGDDQKVDKAYGYTDGDKGAMSPICIQDLYFDCGAKVSIRDGVMLTAQKAVDNKFDMEIIETGAKGTLFLSYTKREKDQIPFDDIIRHALWALNQGTIRLGANKNRGFGRVKPIQVYEKTFTFKAETEEAGTDGKNECRKTVENLLTFLPQRRQISAYGEGTEYAEWEKKTAGTRSDYVKICIPLKQKGGISIRKYSTRPDKADFEHITCNGVPVIPGSSWNGAIRATVRDMLQDLGCKDTNGIIDEWFGSVKTRGSEQAGHQSMIVISESILDQAVPVPTTRNAIDRFSAATKTGALYTSISWFNGKTQLEILIRKNGDGNWKALAGIIILVVKELVGGYVAVGGQTNIGRGIFEADPEKKGFTIDGAAYLWNGSPDKSKNDAGDSSGDDEKMISLDECLNDLYELIDGT